jgi:hypothetical protein
VFGQVVIVVDDLVALQVLPGMLRGNEFCHPWNVVCWEVVGSIPDGVIGIFH